jgi:carbamoyltransferase
VVILGINAYHGDASAALVIDGALVAAAEEERFTRVKHWAGLPLQSIRACLRLAGREPADVDHFAVSRDPRAHLWRKALFALRRRPGLGMVRDRLRNAGRLRDLAGDLAAGLGLDRARVAARLHPVEHHPAHLASAFFVSPFGEAAVCALDGFGDFVSTSWAAGRDRRLGPIERVHFPHSLGLLYLAVTQYLGFPRYGDEFKVMGLAPYGSPDFVEPLGRLVHLRPGGRFALDLAYFRHTTEGVAMTWEAGEPVLGLAYSDRLPALLGPARRPDEPLTPRHEAIAASLQAVFERAAFHVLAEVARRTGARRLALAGGCAMNSVANGKLREQTPFQEVFVQPAAADNGTALGAAYWVWNQVLGGARRFVMEHGSWGPAFGDDAIAALLGAQAAALAARGCRVRRVETDEELCELVAERIAGGAVVGWFQGAMEWGARALGNRSILADPRRPDMREVINTRIKFREKFRPFAPSVLEEALDAYFVGARPDPFMVTVYPVRPERRAAIPAVVHVDGSGRLQTVSRDGNPLYWRLLRAFEKRTGVPVLLNTSFNENEPIVHAPAEALDCFLRTRMDALALGRHLLEKGP